jgi:alkyldihydroxyacetonephosphate synthase
MVGEDNIKFDEYSRVRAGYGAGMIDILRLRKKIVENIPDLVIHPRDTTDVENIVNFCNQENIPVNVYSGGSSVTRGFEATRGGVTLVMSTHMNQLIDFNETNQTITIQSGMAGPELENLLNNAPRLFNANHRYTCGHFPQSFEYSTVGGWVVTRGAGQNSTYYGKIEDIVLSQEYVTPIGKVKTPDYPRSATGPDLNQIMIGSEGIFGILVNVTLKVFRFDPQNRKYFSFMFKNWDVALKASIEIMQGEFGFPSVFRLSDPEETDVGLKMYGVDDSIAERILNFLGYAKMNRCLLLGYTDGQKDFSINIKRQINRICSGHSGISLNAFGITKRWEKNRFKDPYMRDDLLDFGILIDTLECSAIWSELKRIYSEVRNCIIKRPDTICMTHISHAYPQGANLYFIFISRFREINDYIEYQYSILDAIQKSGASMSHHHGIGKLIAPWLEAQIGEKYIRVLRSLKNHFDPNNIMNPGGTLGLDMSEEQETKHWGKTN